MLDRFNLVSRIREKLFVCKRVIALPLTSSSSLAIFMTSSFSYSQNQQHSHYKKLLITCQKNKIFFFWKLLYLYAVSVDHFLIYQHSCWRNSTFFSWYTTIISLHWGQNLGFPLSYWAVFEKPLTTWSFSFEIRL